MWLVFSILFVLWVISIKTYMPIVLCFLFFAGMLAMAGAALLEPRRSQHS